MKKSIKYREAHKNGETGFDNITKLEKIKEIWEDIITHRKLKICAGKIEVISTLISDENYNGSEMSDGERAIFYFIGEVLSVPDNSLIIIDEPENHLHKSILIRLWNQLEKEKSNCTFLYVTHNLEFAKSRLNSRIIWVKDTINKTTWDYELLNQIDNADTLKLEILGNRQKILLIEGTPDKSIDNKLYTAIFNEYNIIALESCTNVVNSTKTYKSLKDTHYLEVKGIIDRDRRSQEEIDKYKNDSIYSPEVAEIENLFLLPEIVSFVVKKQGKEQREDELLNKLREKVFEFLNKEKENQALLFTKQRFQNKIYEVINMKSTTIEEYKNNLLSINNLGSDDIYASTLKEIEDVIARGKVLEALKIINNKGLLPYTEISNFFGWKKDYYINYILELLYSENEESQHLKNIFKKYIFID